VAVAGDNHAVGKDVALLAEHLVANAATGGVKVDTVLLRKPLDVAVLLEVALWRARVWRGAGRGEWWASLGDRDGIPSRADDIEPLA
jgi:hypothetical protein